jgi:hypothetical protein
MQIGFDFLIIEVYARSLFFREGYILMRRIHSNAWWWSQRS